MKYLAYFSGLQSPTVEVVGYPNGTVTIPLNLVEVAPLVFASADGNTIGGGVNYHVSFTTGSNGTYFHADALLQYFERLPWYATPVGITNLGYLCLAILLSVGIWPLGALRSRWQRLQHVESTTEGECTAAYLLEIMH